ncbi:hypothetical protein [Lentzea sp. NPDC051838]|uniref:Rv1733c family protein n=1 Tax=Lentzea sp. NPDC051838 TaxID=3154849 RepID=UPI00341D3EA0
MTAHPMSRLVRRVFPGRNPLATYGDRIEGAVLALGVAVALLAVPVAGAVGSETYTGYEARVDAEHASRTQVDAVLVEDTPEMRGHSDGTVEKTPATATWRLPDGSVHKGVVPAAYEMRSGATVRIWTDRGGEAVDPPMTHEGAVVGAFMIAFLLWSVLTGVMTLFYGVVRFLHMRIRLRWWKLEWELTAPDWTGR